MQAQALIWAEVEQSWRLVAALSHTYSDSQGQTPTSKLTQPFMSPHTHTPHTHPHTHSHPKVSVCLRRTQSSLIVLSHRFLPKLIIKSLSPSSSPGEELQQWNLIKSSMSRAQMKLSHQSHSWDRMTQINKTWELRQIPVHPGDVWARPGLGWEQSDSPPHGGVEGGKAAAWERTTWTTTLNKHRQKIQLKTFQDSIWNQVDPKHCVVQRYWVETNIPSTQKSCRCLPECQK